MQVQKINGQNFTNNRQAKVGNQPSFGMYIIPRGVNNHGGNSLGKVNKIAKTIIDKDGTANFAQLKTEAMGILNYLYDKFYIHNIDRLNHLENGGKVFVNADPYVANSLSDASKETVGIRLNLKSVDSDDMGDIDYIDIRAGLDLSDIAKKIQETAIRDVNLEESLEAACKKLKASGNT
ncbi:MAG: hypothetical protein WCY19_07475 [Candidatus Gastranaerophilaceae bacterium]